MVKLILKPFLAILPFALLAEVITPPETLSEYSNFKSSSGTTYDFKGNYPQLDTLNIENSRQKSVQLLMPGTYANLKTLYFTNTWGKGYIEFTGDFPVLETGEIETTSGNLTLDLKGEFKRPLNLEINSTSGNVEVLLPRHYPISLTTIVTSGKVVNHSPIKERDGGYFSFSRKRSFTLSPNTELSRINITIRTTSGNILLK